MLVVSIVRHCYSTLKPFWNVKGSSIVRVLLCKYLLRMRNVITSNSHAVYQRYKRFNDIAVVIEYGFHRALEFKNAIPQGL